MAKYKLLKDLLGVKAGTICETDDDGRVKLEVDGCGIVALLSTNVEGFSQYFEKVSEYKRWRADRGDNYYYVDGDGSVTAYGECGDETDNNLYKIGNYFKTEEEAKQKRDYNISLQTIKDDAKGFVPDWKSGGERKYFVVYGYGSRLFSVDSACVRAFCAPVYFASKDDAYESTKKHRKEWIIVLGIKEESE